MPLGSVATPLILTDPGYLFTADLASTLPTMAAAGSSYAADAWPVALKAVGATEDPSREAWWSAIKASNHQHPDHDTDVWPQKQQ